MRILLISDYYPPESNPGAIRCAAHARRWAARGHEVTVITSFPNFPEGRVHPGYRQSLYRKEGVDGVNVVRVPTIVFPNVGTIRRTIDFLSFMCSSLIAALLIRRPDVVIATSPQFFAMVSGWLAAKLRGRPLVLEVRDLWPDSVVAVGAMREGRSIALVRRLERLLYLRASLIVTVTEAIGRAIQERGVPREKLVAIPNGVDLSRFKPGDGARVRRLLGLGDRVVVSHIGTVGLSHRPDLLLEAAGRLLHSHPWIAFMFVGGGANWDSLRHTVRERSLTNVVMVDRVPHNEIADFWAASDITLALLKERPVFRTVVPSKVFEAMATGTPVITNVEGELDAIVDRHGGVLRLGAADGDTLADAIAELAADPATRRRLSQQGSLAARHFDRTTQADRMLERLQGLLGLPGDTAGEGAAPPSSQPTGVVDKN